jgi:AraC-like DNA-binding protein
VNITYYNNSYKKLLEDIAAKTNSTLQNNTLYFSPAIAEGILALVELPGGLSFMKSDYIANTDIVFERKTSNEESYTLHVDFVETTGESHFEIDNKHLGTTSNIYANILMSSSKYSLNMVIKKNTIIKSLNFRITKNWMEKYFPLQDIPYWLNYFQAIRLNGINRVPLDFNARKLLFEILAFPEDNPAYLIYIQTRIYGLMDYYGDSIIRQVKNFSSSEILTTDVARIIELDVMLNTQENQAKPLPSITEMAKITGISGTKLKVLFKKMYNQTLVEYFTNCRLLAAKEKLGVGELSIKEIAALYGYKTVQHFTTAFKKHFGQTPSNFL